MDGANAAGIANAHHQPRQAQGDMRFSQRRQTQRIEGGLNLQGVMPYLPAVDAHPSRLHGLFAGDRQRLRQPVVHPATLIGDLFLVLPAGQRLGYRNSDQRPGEFLRTAGALLNGVHYLAAIISPLIDELPDHH